MLNAKSENPIKPANPLGRPKRIRMSVKAPTTQKRAVLLINGALIKDTPLPKVFTALTLSYCYDPVCGRPRDLEINAHPSRAL
jgi:hypothetical protein